MFDLCSSHADVVLPAFGVVFAIVGILTDLLVAIHLEAPLRTIRTHNPKHRLLLRSQEWCLAVTEQSCLWKGARLDAVRRPVYLFLCA